MIFDRLFTRSYEKSVHYMDYSATGRVKPQCVINAINRELRRPANPGRGGNAESVRATMALENCRDAVREITALPNVILTKNCTEALNIATNGLCKNGTVITSDYEHNAVLRPLYNLRDKGIINLKIIKSSLGKITADMLSEAITEDTQTVVLSAMSNVTGAGSDIAEIAPILQEKNIKFIVDTAQSAGLLPINYHGVTAICSSGHKGLNGPQGTGFLALSEECEGALEPLLLGGTGTDAESEKQPLTLPEGFESGTQNTPGFSGLAEGIRWTYAHAKQIENKVSYLSQKVYDGLTQINDITVYSPEKSHVISFNHSNYSPAEVSDYLSDRGIFVRSGLHCAPLAHKALGTFESGGTVRVSFGLGSDEGDVNALLTALRYIKNSR